MSWQTHLQERVVAVVDEGQILQPSNPVWDALHEEASYLQNATTTTSNCMSKTWKGALSLHSGLFMSTVFLMTVELLLMLLAKGTACHNRLMSVAQLL